MVKYLPPQPGRDDQVRGGAGRPSIPLPAALRPNKFQSLSVLSATTEKPPSPTFSGDFGLKPPSEVSAGFTEYVDPAVLSSHYGPTERTFQSLIKVPSALNLHGGFSQSPSQAQTGGRPQKTVLAFKIPPAIIQAQKPQQHHHHHHGLLSSLDLSLRFILFLTGSEVDDKLKELQTENSFLNNLVKKLLLDEVERRPSWSGSGAREKMTQPSSAGEPTVLKLSNKLGNYKFFSHSAPTGDTRKEPDIGEENDFLRRKLLGENVLDAVKHDPFLLARIQGLKNLQHNHYR